MTLFDNNNPQVQYKGFVTSTFQEDPFSSQDIWDSMLEKGLNREVIYLWNERGRFSVKQFSRKLENAFVSHAKKYRKEYDKFKITDVRNRIYIIQLDLSIIREVTKLYLKGDEFARAFIHSLAKILDSMKVYYLTPQVIVNQYSYCIGKECKKNCTKFGEKLEAFKNLLVRVWKSNGNYQSNFNFKVSLIPCRDLDYWKLYIDKIIKLGGNAFRMSAEWARLVNKDGSVNDDEFKKFLEIIKYAKSKDIYVTICFHHFTLPKWIEGGWLNKNIDKLFANYCVEILKLLEKENCLPDQVLTINEPNAFIPAGYLDGSFPPFRKFKVIDFFKVINKSLEAHILAYQKIKEQFESLPVGFTYNFPIFEPYYSWSPVDHLICKIIRYFSDLWFEKLLKKAEKSGRFPFDFLGLQYYNKFYVGLSSSNISANSGNLEVPERLDPFINGWSRFPQGLKIQSERVSKKILLLSRALQNSDLPYIFFTELGVPSIVNPENELKELFKQINEIEGSIDIEVRGVLLWTLFDNYEWAAGYEGPFGYYRFDGAEKP